MRWLQRYGEPLPVAGRMTRLGASEGDREQGPREGEYGTQRGTAHVVEVFRQVRSPRSSVGMTLAKAAPNGEPENLQVEPQRPMGNVVEIELHAPPE